MFEDYYEDVGQGWKKILETAGEKIQRALKERDLPSNFVRVGQVKEKFSQLRIYIDFRSQIDFEALEQDVIDTIYEAITEAERASGKTCELCGEPGYGRSPQDSKSGWLKTYCETHHAERDVKYKKDSV